MTSRRSAYSGLSSARLPNGDILIAGSEYPLSSSRTAERYVVRRGLWRAAGRLSLGRSPTLFGLPSGRVLAIGGDVEFVSDSRAVDLYRPRANRWRRQPNLPYPFGAAETTSLDGYPLAIGECWVNGTRPCPKVATFLPATHRWMTLAPLPVQRSEFGAVLLKDGSTLVTGGYPPPSGTTEFFGSRDAYRYYPGNHAGS
jgi:hypothetical protein